MSMLFAKIVVDIESLPKMFHLLLTVAVDAVEEMPFVANYLLHLELPFVSGPMLQLNQYQKQNS